LPLPNAGEDEPRCYQAVASYITGESETGDQVVVILRDITEERQLEDAKSNFLSVISHELRTPLNSIKGFLNIILEGRAGALNELQRDFLDTASGQAEYLNVMISDLVEFSRIQVRRTELANDPVSMGDVAGSVAGRLLPLASEKQITIVNEVASDVSLVDGDRLRLDQVVSNLVSNAIKFTPSGGVVTLSAEEQDGHLVLSVADTGVGIPADERERIFEPFYQVSHGSARLYGGLGLGLAICKHIVDCHGGRILVESEEGRGSVFRVVLPLHQVREAAPSFELALRT
jgi:signal transduction histidine kinase